MGVETSSLSTKDIGGERIKPPIEIGEPINLDEVLSRYQDRIEVSDPDQITQLFNEKRDENSICLEVPIRGKSEEEVREELSAIDRKLDDAIYQYTGLDVSTPIGFDIKGILREMLGDIDKHARPNYLFSRIFVLVTKDGTELSFHIANPARPNIDLRKISEEDSADDYDLKAHGKSLTEQFRGDLIDRGVDVSDQSQIIEGCGVSRDIKITLHAKN